jgi:hypothetical protein
MNTKDLPNEILKVKQDIQKRILEFNKETGLSISGIMVEGIFAEEFDNAPVVKAYKISVGIDL